MPVYASAAQSSLIIADGLSYQLETNSQGMTLSSATQEVPLFTLIEPVLLAQAIAEGENQIHIAYLKANGELCYSIISATGEQHTMALGKLDTRNHRYDRLILLPQNKVIHIFYATSHVSLPDVWRITHLLWNGLTWKSAQLGEVVHPYHPLYQVLVDSKSNLHVLMMTFLGSRSILMSIFFNGSFHIWSKRQEVLSIPREVIDMSAVITSMNTCYIFWAAKQPGTEKYEIGCATQAKTNDFMSPWKIEPNPAVNINGPWKGLGVLASSGILSLLLHAEQVQLIQYWNNSWNWVKSSSSQHSGFQLIHKTKSVINYTNWLNQDSSTLSPLFASEVHLEFNPKKDITEKKEEDCEQAVSAMTIPPVAAGNQRPLPSPHDTSKKAEEMDLSIPPESINISDYEAAADTLPETIPEAIPVMTADLTSTTTAEPILTSGVISELTPETAAYQSHEKLMALITEIQDKIEPIPENINYLIQKHEETLKALRLLENKVTQLKTEREVAARKGFWSRWFT